MNSLLKKWLKKYTVPAFCALFLGILLTHIVGRAAAVTISGSFSGTLDGYDITTVLGTPSADNTGSKGEVSINGLVVTLKATSNASYGLMTGWTYTDTTTSVTLTRATGATAYTVYYRTSAMAASEADKEWKLSEKATVVESVTASGGASRWYSSPNSATLTVTITKIEKNTSNQIAIVGSPYGTAVASIDNGEYTIGPTYSATLNNKSVLRVGTVTPASSDYSFAGWATRTEAGYIEYLSFETNSDGQQECALPAGTYSLFPVFVHKDWTSLYRVDNTANGTTTTSYYCFFDEAVSAATLTSDGKVVLCETGEMRLMTGNTVKIPSNVTFVLPYSSGDTSVQATDSNGEFKYANYTKETYASAVAANDSRLNPEADGLVTYTLTIPAGIEVVNDGKIALGGTISSQTGIAGATTGARSVIRLNGTLTVGGTGVLSVCGYIVGAGAIDATASGATVCQPFVVGDFAGGGYTVGLAGQSDGKGLSSHPNGETSLLPFTQYFVRNIQTTFILGGGATLYGYADLYASDDHHQCVMAIAGKTGLLTLAQNATMTATYDSTTFVAGYDWIGRTTLTVEGGASLGDMTLTLTVAGKSYSIPSSSLSFALPYNFEVILDTDDNGSGSYSIPYALKLLPGSKLVVAEDATLTISNKFAVYDQLYDTKQIVSGETHTTTSETLGHYPYPTPTAIFNAYGSQSAVFVVNGTLELTGGAFGGIIQTESENAKIVVSSGVGTSVAAQHGGVGHYSVTILIIKNHYAFAGASVHTIDARIYDASQQKYVSLEAGKTYYSKVDTSTKNNSYSYAFYGNSSSPTAPTETKTGTIKEGYLGAWYTHRVDYYENDSFIVTEYHIGDAFPEPSYTHEADNSLAVYLHGAWTTTSVNSYTRKYNRTCEGPYLAIYSDSTTKDDTTWGIANMYRLDDYLWLNAVGYLNGAFNSGSLSVTTYDTNGNVIATNAVGAKNANKQSVQIAVVGTTVYLVKAIPAKEIPDAITFSISYNDGTNTYTSVKFTVSLEAYSATLTGNDKTLADKLIAYGNAAKDYADSDTTLENGHTVKGNTVGDGFKLSQTGDPIPWNGVTLETTAANVYFDEALRLGISYQLSGIPEGYTIKQIGLLVGELSSESEELTLEKHNMAYLLFNAIPNGSVVDGDTIQNAEIGKYPDNGPWDTDDKIIVMPDGTFTVPTISGNGTSGKIVFDLKAQEYKTMFSLRPAIVFEKDGKYVCVYGRQIGYGLGAYINGVYDKDSDGKATTDEFKYLLEQLWALAGVTSPTTGG